MAIAQLQKRNSTEAIAVARPRRLMRLPAVKEALGGASSSTVYGWIAAGKFPKPISLGRRVSHPLSGHTRSTSVAWLADEVEAFIDERAAERDEALAS